MSFVPVDTITEQPHQPRRRPEWIKVRVPGGENYDSLKTLMRSKQLHTVCEDAHCPNIGECWGAGTATFLIMGDICTRSCAFCDIANVVRRVTISGRSRARLFSSVPASSTQEYHTASRSPFGHSAMVGL